MSKAERTRQFIVEKTAPLFNAKGYAGTSLSDMTDATGLTKGSIYGNFANKDEVALAVFDHNWGRVQSLLRSEMDRRSTCKSQVVGARPNLREWPVRRFSRRRLSVAEHGD